MSESIFERCSLGTEVKVKMLSIVFTQIEKEYFPNTMFQNIPYCQI